MPFLRVKVGNIAASAGAAGNFSIANGAFGSGNYEIELDYDSSIPNGVSAGTGLQIVDERESPRSETVKTDSVSEAAGTVDLGQVMVNTVDCEIWRLGARVVGAYHDATHRSPPAGRLRIKRWNAVNFGTPYTFHDYIVLATKWGTGSAKEWQRREKLFHEFGHTVRHVADGDMSHWNWDDFR